MTHSIAEGKRGQATVYDDYLGGGWAKSVPFAHGADLWGLHTTPAAEKLTSLKRPLKHGESDWWMSNV
jgi:hypothetical protein